MFAEVLTVEYLLRIFTCYVTFPLVRCEFVDNTLKNSRTIKK